MAIAVKSFSGDKKGNIERIIEFIRREAYFLNHLLLMVSLEQLTGILQLF